MSHPDPLVSVLRDFDALSKSDQRLILADFNEEERLAIQRMSVSGTFPSSLEDHSSWFEDLVAAARRDEGEITTRAREALLATFGPPASFSDNVAKPSLFQLAGSALMQTRVRR